MDPIKLTRSCSCAIRRGQVDVTGSDRFGRTTNPEHSNLISKTYGQISGKWYMNVEPGAEQWFLRHDTTYPDRDLERSKRVWG